MASSLVTCAWLKEQLQQTQKPNLVVLDGTFYLPAAKRDADKEYLERHIEGAVRFDIDVVADKTTTLPHMLPSAEQFAEQVGKMGINNDTHVVVYDNNEKFGLYSAGRVWWMFKVFGHASVSIVDGGLPKWLSEGYPTVSGPPTPVATATYKAVYNPALVRDLTQMLDNYASKKEIVVDGRPKGRFDGTAPEPNPRIPSGHILDTTSLPFMELLDPQSKTLKEKLALQQEFNKVGVDFSKPVVVTCGGAVVAPLLAFAAHLLGKDTPPVYDGSWADWVVNAPKDTMHIGVKGEDLK